MKFFTRSGRFVQLAGAFFILSCTAARTQAGRFAQPVFADANRLQRVESVLPEVDQLYADLARVEHLPGLVYGVILDGKLIHARALGFANLEQKIPAAPDTRFRIASMTKSFVAMAALKLRDEGRLSLADPVEKYLPEFHRLALPTADATALTIYHLLTMSTGLPEDNPWADRHIEFTNAELEQLVGGGLSFSTEPGHGYEYSNLGYVLLGKIVTRVAGVRFQDYITKNILKPLGMNDTVWEYASVPPGKLASGYQWRHNAWELEPMLHDGDGAAMSGLITTLDDFTRYVNFHLAADPARDETDSGPVGRATLRDMHQPRVFARMNADNKLLDGTAFNPVVSFYGYGLIWSRDARGTVKVAHSGGLPGFGSIYRFCPELGIGIIAFTNLRYGPVYTPTNQALDRLIERGKLSPRSLQTSAILQTRTEQVLKLIQSWDPELCSVVVADNFFLDRTREDWVAEAGPKLAGLGRILTVGPMIPENQLRGSFTLDGENGRLKVAFTLTPEKEPKMQELHLTVVPAK